MRKLEDENLRVVHRRLEDARLLQGRGLRPSHHRSLPGTLDMLRRRGIVLPNQTLNQLLSTDGLSYFTPRKWHKQVRSREQGQHLPRGLVVFKRGGSGSTWFDATLSSHPSVTFQHEAQAFFRSNDTPEQKTDILVDFLNTNKLDDTYRGFSISPAKHGRGLDWPSLFRRTGASLVVFVRTNVVKRRVGLMRKGYVKRLPSHCHGSGGGGRLVNYASEPTPECSLHNSTVMLSDEDLARLDHDCFQQTWELIDMALSLGVPFQVVSFEGMQKNLTATMNDVGLYAGWDVMAPSDGSNGPEEKARAMIFPGARAQTRSRKVTREDLKQVVSNFAQVDGALESRDCFQSMLRAEKEDIFPLCYLPVLGGWTV